MNKKLTPVDNFDPPVTQRKVEDIIKAHLNETVKGLREDFLLIFGIFASILIFLSIEVQVFQEIKRFSYLVGISFFLLASLLSFALSLKYITKGSMEWHDFGKPLPIVVIVLFLFSIFCFAWGAVIHPA